MLTQDGFKVNRLVPCRRCAYHHSVMYTTSILPHFYMTQSTMKLLEGTSVWVVDDHHEFRDTIQELVNSETGMHCTQTFASCEELIEALNTLPIPEIILMDISFPGRMSGIEGIRKLRRLHVKSRILLLTMHLDDDVIFSGLSAGAHGYLFKMGAPEHIVQGIRNVTEKGVMDIPPAIAQRILDHLKPTDISRDASPLTPREDAVLQHLKKGESYREIADRLRVSPFTVQSHVQNIYLKLHRK